MLGSTILDVAIGVVFVYLVASLIASAVREGIEAFLKTRASHLEAGLRELLRDKQGTGLVKQLFDHPVIYSLYAGDYTPLSNRTLAFRSGENLPSYIPSRNFALALMDMAARGPQLVAGTSAEMTAPITLDSIRANVGTIENASVQRALLIALDRAQGDLDRAQANIEAWYDSAMDRVSGWYKRSTQWFLLGIGLFLAIALNVNTLTIANTLYHDRTQRDLLVESAQTTVTNAGGKLPSYQFASAELGKLNLPIGWPADWKTVEQQLRDHWPADLAGWFLTAFAVSAGAPFWFDLLNKLIVIRSTVKPHQKSPEEPSQDRSQGASDQAVAAAAVDAPAPAAPVQEVAQPAAAAAPPEDAGAVAPGNDDGGDVETIEDATRDEDLPVAVGGVSQ